MQWSVPSLKANNFTCNTKQDSSFTSRYLPSEQHLCSDN